MSTLLLKLNFQDKDNLTVGMLRAILMDVKKEIKKKELFTKQEKIYMNYNIKPKK
jgi:hypothetical protein